MTVSKPDSTPRRPRAFDLDDPRLETPPPPPPEPPPVAPSKPAEGEIAVTVPTRADLDAGWRWGSALVSAAVSLALLALGVWYARLVSVVLARDDWLGWAAWGIAAVLALSLAVIVLREIVGLMRLSRLGRLRREAERILAAPTMSRDTGEERALARRLVTALSRRRESAWSVARYHEAEADVVDRGALLALADRELLAPIDAEARRAVLASAKRVATVSTLSPMMLLTMGFITAETLRLLRALATLYGGRPGWLGGLKLFRLVVSHIVATGGIALTDDLFGQFLGQDLLRRVSSRLGEGAFNAALTARLGAAAIEVIRPLPYIAAPPIRARDIAKEIFRKKPDEPEADKP